MSLDATDKSGDGLAWLPDAVRQFIESAIVTGDMALPFHYPRLQELDAWQSGFRRHGITGENLVSSAPGAWQPDWLVIALNGFDDPFFIDLGEQAQGLPVYYAPHGAGRWDALQVAPNIRRFAQMLSALRDLPDDDTAALRYVEVEAGLTNALWSEVHESRRNRPALEQELTQREAPCEPQDWRCGTLVLVDAGPQRLKVVQHLRKMLGLSAQEALALASRRDIVLAEGSFIQLRSTRDRLVSLGAAVEFVAAVKT